MTMMDDTTTRKYPPALSSKMPLRKKQSYFAWLVARLIITAYARGYEITLGDAYRDPRCPYGSERSLHQVRLAIDLNLFKDGRWLTDGTGHDELHDLWDSWGGAPRIEHDLNHYSLEHEGRR
jgi:hypothetical protein